jgi:hypothetical protein
MLEKAFRNTVHRTIVLLFFNGSNWALPLRMHEYDRSVRWAEFQAIKEVHATLRFGAVGSTPLLPEPKFLREYAMAAFRGKEMAVHVLAALHDAGIVLPRAVLRDATRQYRGPNDWHSAKVLRAAAKLRRRDSFPQDI